VSSGPISLIPIVGKEAAGAKVSVSLLLIVGIAWGAYTLGARSSERIGNIELALVKLTTLSEMMASEQAAMKASQAKVEENQGMAMRDIRAIQERTNMTNTEVVDISAKMGNKRR
jgi:hypothetical protein